MNDVQYNCLLKTMCYVGTRSRLTYASMTCVLNNKPVSSALCLDKSITQTDFC